MTSDWRFCVPGWQTRSALSPVLCVMLLCLAPVYSVSTVHAQQPPSASQVTPPTLRPADDLGAGGIFIPGAASLDVPEGAAGLHVVVAAVEIEGAFPELAEAASALSAGIAGKRLSVAQLYAFAAAVEQVYAAAGYVLVRVVVPPQTLVDHGAFKILIVDGFVEEVDVTSLSPHVRSVVAARMASLVGRRSVTLAEIERRVLLAGQVPGLRMRSTLVRGRQEGGTRLVLEGMHRAAEGSLGVNNHLDESYGRWQYSSQAAINSAFGHGEQIYGSYSGTDELSSTLDGTTPLRIFGAGAVIPIGFDGLILNPEYTQSRSRPLVDAGHLQTEDVFERLAVRVSYPFVLTRARRVELNVAYEHIEQTTEARSFGVDLNRDRYSVLRAGLEHGAATPFGGPLMVSATFSQGLGGRDEGDAVASGVPLSRMGSAPDFSKLLTELYYIQPLPQELQLGLSARGQTSFNTPLFDSEQFSLDGPQTVSGFESGTFSVDQGVAVRVELARAILISDSEVFASITPYLFAAAGRGWLVARTVVELGTVTAASLGVGVRAGLEGDEGWPSGAVSLELSERYTDDPNGPDGFRVMFSSGSSF